MSSLQTALNRLLKINCSQRLIDGDVASSLAGEYIRRVAEMADTEGINLRSPFFDPSTLLSTSGSNVADAMKELLSTGKPWLANAYSRRSSECYLLWSDGIDSAEFLPEKYPMLFDPLIQILELGSEFGLHHGELLIADCAIPLHNWKRLLFARPFNLPASFNNGDPS